MSEGERMSDYSEKALKANHTVFVSLRNALSVSLSPAASRNFCSAG